MRARDFLKENTQNDIHSVVDKFLPFVKQHLSLDNIPEIELLDQALDAHLVATVTAQFASW